MGFVEHAIATLGPWSWWVLGLVLAAVEIFAPGTFFIWFGIAAILVGTLALAVDLGWQVQVVLFLVLALVTALIGRRFYGGAAADAAGPNGLNDPLARHVGRLAVTETRIADGAGTIRLDDTVWRVEGPDLPSGAQVRITGVRQGRLQIEAT